jgi:hypothetical protein
MICSQECQRVKTARPRAAWPRIFTITVLVLVLAAWLVFIPGPETAQAAVAGLTGLRQGRLHVLAGDKGGQIKVDFKPTFGWSEPLLFYGPDGRLLNKTFPNRSSGGQLLFNLDRGPGHYVLILKPSYQYQVSVTGGQMVYQPPVEQTGLRVLYGQQELYFVVPQGVPEFTLYWMNHRGYKGSAARITLYDPAGRRVDDQSAPLVDPAKIMADLIAAGQDSSELNTSAGSGNFNPDTNPVPPMEIHVASPPPGSWKVVVGTTDGTVADNVGLWLEGAPSFFSNQPNQYWQPKNGKDTAWAKVAVTAKVLPKPLLGVVGFYGPPGGVQEQGLYEYGVQAEAPYLLHPLMEPKNDNTDPAKADAAKFQLKHTTNILPRPGKFSLVILERWADWVNGLPAQKQTQEWAEWVEVSTKALVEQQKMPPTGTAVQFMNEANVRMDLSQYLGFLQAAGTRLKNNYVTKSIPIAAPAIATGLSKGDTKGLSFLDTRWIEESLRKYDSLVDVVVFNVYGASELEDTLLFPMLVEQVSGIIKTVNPDGKIEPIMIGATNREGGLVSPRLFNEWDGGLWWASALAQVANTGQVKVINYFNLVDKGIRQKGLFTATGEPKHQAVIQKLYANVFGAGDLLQTTSDHAGLECVTVKSGAGLKMILVNKSWMNIEAVIQAPTGLKITQSIVYQGKQPVSYTHTDGKTTILVQPETVVQVEMK